MSRLALFILFPLLLGACAPYPATQHPGPTCYYPPEQNQPLSRQLRVQAEAQVEAVPDLVRMRLGVVTEAADANQAVSQNNQRMRAIMTQLLGLGLKQDDLATGQFQISPQWSQPPRPTPANWQREIIGYRVNNDLWVTTTRVDLAGELLGLGHRSGANQVGNLNFSVADPESFFQQALTLATEKAMRQAQTLADAAQTHLGNILSLHLDHPGSSYIGAPMMMEARVASPSDTVPITPGKVEIKAGVTIIFALQSTPAAAE